MKEVSNAELQAMMGAMPSEAVAALQSAHAEHDITEREARWWGYLMFAKTGGYEAIEHTMAVGTTGDMWTETFIDYVLACRASDTRHGLVRRAWPEMGVDFVQRI